MPESGEWFSARTRPEMLTSDDPPLAAEKPEHLEILPGPGTRLARVFAPVTRVLALIPELGRWIVRVERPTRWQLAGMWAAGSAIVVGTGLAVAALVGGAPPSLSQQLDRMVTLPGENEESSSQDPGPEADGSAAVPGGQGGRGDTGTGARDFGRTSGGTGGSSSYGGYVRIPGVPEGAEFPPGVGLPDVEVTSAPGGTGASAPVPGTTPTPSAGGSTTPAPGPSSSPAPPPQPSDTGTPTSVEPAPTTPPPTDTPTDTPTPTVEPTAAETTQPPAEDQPAETTPAPTPQPSDTVVSTPTVEPTP